MKSAPRLLIVLSLLLLGCKKDESRPAPDSRHGPARDDVRKVDISQTAHSGTAPFTIRIRIAYTRDEQDTAKFVTVTKGTVTDRRFVGIGSPYYSTMARPSQFTALVDVRYLTPPPATNVIYVGIGQDDNTLMGVFIGTGKPANETHLRVVLDPTLLHN